ncbi:hypothetical protein AVEN_129128-1 [Araneus ventricosus]|uniref:Uncharacterized protein n=1 Tax=Araneus ventricosus TaxID=182803 RepID=A0A4Y2S0X2_ARAVE|nr:hypothetical protein AVEN_129128-1 [Araneus ventricosus]
MTRTTSNQAPSSSTFCTAPAGGRLARGVGVGVRRARIRGGSTVRSGFGPGSLQARRRGRATRPPWPPFDSQDSESQQWTLCTVWVREYKKTAVEE